LSLNNRCVDILSRYVWLVGAALTAIIVFLYGRTTNNNFIDVFGPSLAILLLGVFIGVKYIYKIETKLLSDLKREHFWKDIGPPLIESLKLDVLKILIELYKMNFLKLETDIHKVILCGQEDLALITGQELGKEFKLIAEKLSSPDLNEEEIEYLLVNYSRKIRIYLEDIEHNIAPLVFMHSENAHHIDLFITFNRSLIKINEAVLKHGRPLNSNIILYFVDLFNILADICINIASINGDCEESQIDTQLCRLDSIP